MQSIISFLNVNEGALMVVITTVYVIATIAICWANIKSANASKQQLKETQRQFYAVNRPNITPTIEYINRTFWVLRFTNCGTQTAFNVSIELDCKFIDSITEPTYKSLLLKNNGKKCIIGINQYYDLFIGSSAYRDVPNKPPIKGVVRYNGVNSSIYVENFEIDTNNYVIFFSADSFEDKSLKCAKMQTEEMNRIADYLGEIALNSSKVEGEDNV